MKTYIDDMEYHDLSNYNHPYVRLKHIDGPMITFSDGQQHWLTLCETFRYKFGWADAWTIQQERRPKLTEYLKSKGKV